MALLCKHCASPCGESPVEGAFCCQGCEQVYRLIQSEGLDGFYDQQDRASQPIKERVLDPVKAAYFLNLQRNAEASERQPCIELIVEGMSCTGCAWLVEQLAKRQAGVQSARVRLSLNCLSLKWVTGVFDLASLATELRCFGYTLSGEYVEGGIGRISPMAWRALLVALFAVNATILAALEYFVFSNSQASYLPTLLSIGCAIFCLLLGGASFLLPVYHAFKIGKWHSDLWALSCLFLFFVSAVSFCLLGYAVSLVSAALCSFIFTLVFARWLGTLFTSRKD